jgi:hypothetical protein
MKILSAAILAAAIFALTGAGSPKVTALVGVIDSYISGNQGTDMIVKTPDGHVHRLWFDNMKKPSFLGKQLPWCPEFPCDGWPSQLVLGKTRVSISVITQGVEGESVVTPIKIALAK